MKIVTVIPIKKSVGKDTLSYFTSKDIGVGSIVEIPLRKKMAYGLVVEKKDAEELKTEIKSLPYSIRKIENIKSFSFVSKDFIEGVRKIAEYNATSVGSVLSALIPKTVLEECKNLVLEEREKPKGVFHETVLLQTDNEERFSTYKSLIREEFAKNRSVFFCLPTTEDLLNARETLEKGIESYTYTLHSGLPKKDIISLWKKIISEKHPVLVLGTGPFLSIPREDFGTIILEKESSRGYKMQIRPYLDLRFAVEEIAKNIKARLVLGDDLLRVETLWEEKNGKYAELSPLKVRSLSGVTTSLINLRTPQDMKKKEFSIFSEELKTLLTKTKENNEHTFLFCGRKGLYPTTVCSDCGKVVVCNNCKSPVVLYSKKVSDQNKNLFVCHHCGERREASELCKYCGGWRLTPLGVGIDRVAEEIKNVLKNPNIFIMDKDHVKNHKEAVKLRNAFYQTAGSIMIGTEMSLTYLNQKVENAGVVSIDSYFSIPDYQINEKVFHILLSMRALAQSKFIIQTRQENTRIFDYAIHGNLVDFYRDEIEDRKSTEYPPFATYIKISLTGEKTKVKKEMLEIKEFLKPFEMEVYDAWNPGSSRNFTVNGLLGLQKKKWVDKTLLQKLRSLPPYFSIKVDPISFL